MTAHAPDVPPICAALRAARESAGLTLKQVAEGAGVTYQRIQQWERGREPELAMIAKLEQVLDPDRLRGWLLRAAGYVEDAETLEDKIASDHRLDGRGRDVVRLLLDPGSGG